MLTNHPAFYQQLIDGIHVSNMIKNSPSANRNFMIEKIYELWRQGRLQVIRDWGDSSLEADAIVYTNKACLLPTDWVRMEKPDALASPTTVKVATWNVNSIRARMPLCLSWLEAHEPDIVCLQETKVEDHLFPFREFRLVGYETAFYGQKTFNGVAILSKRTIEEMRFGFTNGFDHENKRLIAVKVYGMWIINIYVPQGESANSPKFAYKLKFLEELIGELQHHYDPSKPIMLVGDYNVAPDSRDVVDPETMAECVSFHSREHSLLEQIKQWGFIDVFRQFHKEAGMYTWWDFRTHGFEKNDGMRIDHIWTTPTLLPSCLSCAIDIETRAQPDTSDHAPVFCEASLEHVSD